MAVKLLSPTTPTFRRLGVTALLSDMMMVGFALSAKVTQFFNVTVSPLEMVATRSLPTWVHKMLLARMFGPNFRISLTPSVPRMIVSFPDPRPNR